LLHGDREQRIQLTVMSLDPPKQCLRQFHGREIAPLQPLGELRQSL
jgi:hypothetical protein